MRKKEKQLSSQYDKYFGRVIIFLKDIIFERENILKSDSFFLLRRDQMLCISVFMFFESVQSIFLPGHFWLTGRQLHNSRSYVFYVFYVSMFAYMNGVSWKLLSHAPLGVRRSSTTSPRVWRGCHQGGVASNWYRARYSNPPCNWRPRHTHSFLSLSSTMVWHKPSVAESSSMPKQRWMRSCALLAP